MTDLINLAGEVYAGWFSTLGFGRRMLVVDLDAPEGLRIKLVWIAPKAPRYEAPVHESEILMNRDQLAELGRVKAESARVAYRRMFSGTEEGRA